MKLDVLGIKIDNLNMVQSVDQIVDWISQRESKKVIKNKNYYVVTPNVEFLMLAQKDQEFKEVLNKADLAIPDSARISWAYFETHQNSIVRLLFWLFFLFPKLLPMRYFDIVTGTDLMEELLKVSADKGYTIGLLGGRKKLAENLKECLIKKFPTLKITFASSDLEVDYNGDIILNSETGLANKKGDNTINIPKTDILFVAFGQVKQEKWIYKNLNKYPVKVMVGVGGAFDYLSNQVPRAPKLLRQLGFEWLFRLVIQPWRFKRFWALFKFLGLVMYYKAS